MSPQQWRNPRVPLNAAGILGPQPSVLHQAYLSGPPHAQASSFASPSNWENYSLMNAAFTNLQLQ